MFLCVLTVTRVVTKIILMKLGYRDRRRLEAVLGKPLEKYPAHSKYFANSFRKVLLGNRGSGIPSSQKLESLDLGD